VHPLTPAPTPLAPRDPPRSESVPLIQERSRPVEIDLATAKSLFDGGAALFVDARDGAEFEAGHIPRAVRLTPNDALAEPERVRALAPGARPIVTYCEGGTCEASLDLARALVDAGYRRVLVYAGGFPEWAAAGHPIERGGGGR
jgi:rhodanese-related sulfurtransferase